MLKPDSELIKMIDNQGAKKKIIMLRIKIISPFVKLSNFSPYKLQGLLLILWKLDYRLTSLGV